MWETVWSGINGFIDLLPFLTWWFYGCCATLALMFFLLVPMPGARDDAGGCSGVLGIGAILGLIFWLSFGGGEDGKTAAPERESSPRYSALKDKEGYQRGRAVAIFTATTEATSEKDLRAIVRDMRTKHPDQDGVAVFFKPEDGDLFAAGFAFEDAETEAALIKSFGANRAAWEAGKEGRTVVLLE